MKEHERLQKLKDKLLFSKRYSDLKHSNKNLTEEYKS